MDINLVLSILNFLVDNGAIKYFRVNAEEIFICIKK